jgi:hypothetical protein
MKEKEITKVQPSFVTAKTVADDIAKMAYEYVAKMSKRFKSKLSLSMDIWTGPNRMSFLGITFDAHPPTKKQKRFINANQRRQVDELTLYLQETRSESEDDPLEYWRINWK